MCEDFGGGEGDVFLQTPVRSLTWRFQLPCVRLTRTFYGCRDVAQQARSTTFHGINEWLRDGGPMTLKVTRILWSSSPSLVCAIIPPTSHVCPNDHQDGMQPPCPPQYIFSVCVTWPVGLHSEPRFPETRENRQSAHVIGRRRPPSQLQSQRKVTTMSS